MNKRHEGSERVVLVLTRVDYGRAPGPERQRAANSRGRCVTCDEPTNGGKPYCFAHIAQMPYVAAILPGVDEARMQLGHASGANAEGGANKRRRRQNSANQSPAEAPDAG